MVFVVLFLLVLLFLLDVVLLLHQHQHRLRRLKPTIRKRPVMTFTSEIQDLSALTFEIVEVANPGTDMAATSSSCSCSSCCSCSTSSCCSTSTSTSSCG